MVNTLFTAQATPDIRRKLQKLESFTGMNITQLTEITNKVYMNRVVQAEREAERQIKRKVSLLAITLNERGKRKVEENRPPRVGESRAPSIQDQCAYRKEKGHWMNECPNQEKALRPSCYGKEPYEEGLTGLAGAGSD